MFLLLSGCDSSLSKQDQDVIDALAFLFGDRDREPPAEINIQDSRSVQKKFVQYSGVRSNPSYQSQKPEDAKRSRGKYYRFDMTIEVKQECRFDFEFKEELPDGDLPSQFQPDESPVKVALNLNNATRFDVTVDDRFSDWILVILEGSNVSCLREKCSNRLEEIHFGPKDSRSELLHFLERRRRAVELIKKKCPGRPF